jgi:hypothetical protein
VIGIRDGQGVVRPLRPIAERACITSNGEPTAVAGWGSSPRHPVSLIPGRTTQLLADTVELVTTRARGPVVGVVGREIVRSPSSW